MGLLGSPVFIFRLATVLRRINQLGLAVLYAVTSQTFFAGSTLEPAIFNRFF